MKTYDLLATFSAAAMRKICNHPNTINYSDGTGFERETGRRPMFIRIKDSLGTVQLKQGAKSRDEIITQIKNAGYNDAEAEKLADALPKLYFIQTVPNLAANFLTLQNSTFDDLKQAPLDTFVQNKTTENKNPQYFEPNHDLNESLTFSFDKTGKPILETAADAGLVETGKAPQFYGRVNATIGLDKNQNPELLALSTTSKGLHTLFNAKTNDACEKAYDTMLKEADTYALNPARVKFQQITSINHAIEMQYETIQQMRADTTTTNDFERSFLQKESENAKTIKIGHPPTSLYDFVGKLESKRLVDMIEPPKPPLSPVTAAARRELNHFAGWSQKTPEEKINLFIGSNTNAKLNIARAWMHDAFFPGEDISHTKDKIDHFIKNIEIKLIHTGLPDFVDDKFANNLRESNGTKAIQFKGDTTYTFQKSDAGELQMQVSVKTPAIQYQSGTSSKDYVTKQVPLANDITFTLEMKGEKFECVDCKVTGNPALAALYANPGNPQLQVDAVQYAIVNNAAADTVKKGSHAKTKVSDELLDILINFADKVEISLSNDILSGHVDLNGPIAFSYPSLQGAEPITSLNIAPKQLWEVYTETVKELYREGKGKNIPQDAAFFTSPQGRSVVERALLLTQKVNSAPKGSFIDKALKLTYLRCLKAQHNNPALSGLEKGIVVDTMVKFATTHKLPLDFRGATLNSIAGFNLQNADLRGATIRTLDSATNLTGAKLDGVRDLGTEEKLNYYIAGWKIEAKPGELLEKINSQLPKNDSFKKTLAEHQDDSAMAQLLFVKQYANAHPKSSAESALKKALYLQYKENITEKNTKDVDKNTLQNLVQLSHRLGTELDLTGLILKDTTGVDLRNADLRGATIQKIDDQTKLYGAKISTLPTNNKTSSITLSVPTENNKSQALSLSFQEAIPFVSSVIKSLEKEKGQEKIINQILTHTADPLMQCVMIMGLHNKEVGRDFSQKEKNAFQKAFDDAYKKHSNVESVAPVAAEPREYEKPAAAPVAAQQTIQSAEVIATVATTTEPENKEALLIAAVPTYDSSTTGTIDAHEKRVSLRLPTNPENTAYEPMLYQKQLDKVAKQLGNNAGFLVENSELPLNKKQDATVVSLLDLLRATPKTDLPNNKEPNYAGVLGIINKRDDLQAMQKQREGLIKLVEWVNKQGNDITPETVEKAQTQRTGSGFFKSAPPLQDVPKNLMDAFKTGLAPTMSKTKAPQP